MEFLSFVDGSFFSKRRTNLKSNFKNWIKNGVEILQKMSSTCAVILSNRKIVELWQSRPYAPRTSTYTKCLQIRTVIWLRLFWLPFNLNVRRNINERCKFPFSCYSCSNDTTNQQNKRININYCIKLTNEIKAEITIVYFARTIRISDIPMHKLLSFSLSQ